MRYSVKNFTNRDELTISSLQFNCQVDLQPINRLVSLSQSSGSLSIQFDMTIEQALQLSEALIAAAGEIDVDCEK